MYHGTARRRARLIGRRARSAAQCVGSKTRAARACSRVQANLEWKIDRIIYIGGISPMIMEQNGFDDTDGADRWI
jgi:hypothetical protein